MGPALACPVELRVPPRERRPETTAPSEGTRKKCCRRHGKTHLMGRYFCVPQRPKTKKKISKSTGYWPRARWPRALSAECPSKTPTEPSLQKVVPSTICEPGMLRAPNTTTHPPLSLGTEQWSGKAFGGGCDTRSFHRGVRSAMCQGLSSGISSSRAMSLSSARGF